MSVFLRFQVREKRALFYANQFPQPLAIVSAITFAGIVFFTVCLFTKKTAKIASKFFFDFHSVSRAICYFRIANIHLGLEETHLQKIAF